MGVLWFPLTSANAEHDSGAETGAVLRRPAAAYCSRGGWQSSALAPPGLLPPLPASPHFHCPPAQDGEEKTPLRQRGCDFSHRKDMGIHAGSTAFWRLQPPSRSLSFVEPHEISNILMFFLCYIRPRLRHFAALLSHAGPLLSQLTQQSCLTPAALGLSSLTPSPGTSWNSGEVIQAHGYT